MFSDVICPVNNNKINKNLSRVTVFINASLLALYVITGMPLLVALVALDYGIRAIWKPEYSPLRWVALQIVNVLNIPEKEMDQAPKLFASRVGFLFAFASLIFVPISMPVSLVVAGILTVFAYADSVLDFCVGCITYTYIVLPFYQYLGIRSKA